MYLIQPSQLSCLGTAQLVRASLITTAVLLSVVLSFYGFLVLVRVVYVYNYANNSVDLKK